MGIDELMLVLQCPCAGQIVGNWYSVKTPLYVDSRDQIFISFSISTWTHRPVTRTASMDFLYGVWLVSSVSWRKGTVKCSYYTWAYRSSEINQRLEGTNMWKKYSFIATQEVKLAQCPYIFEFPIQEKRLKTFLNVYRNYLKVSQIIHCAFASHIKERTTRKTVSVAEWNQSWKSAYV